MAQGEQLYRSTAPTSSIPTPAADSAARPAATSPTLLYSVKGLFELSEQLAGDVALQAGLDVAFGLAVGSAAIGVRAGGGVVAHAMRDDDVDGSVELAVAASVEPEAGGLPG